MSRLTAVDLSVPRIRVVMTKQDYDRYPAFSLPEGFAFAPYDAGRREDWVRLQTATGNAPSADAAAEILRAGLREEVPGLGERDYSGQLARRMIFVQDANGVAAGTACLWFGQHFGDPRSKLHWVAVDPAYQGRGLAKAMLTRLLDMNMELKQPLYLVSATGNYRALGIYELFGFQPYMGPMPPHWQLHGGDAACFEHLGFKERNALAWSMIKERQTNC